MPSKNELREIAFSRWARRLQRAGMPLDEHCLAGLPRGIVIEPCEESYVAAEVFDTDRRGTGLIADLKVWCDVGSISIDRVELELPWCTIEEWVFDTRLVKPARGQLRHGNIRPIKKGLSGRHGKASVRKGLILGITGEPIPDNYRSGDAVKGTLILLDLFGNEFSGTLEFLVHRCGARRTSKTTTVPASRLFERLEQSCSRSERISDGNLGFVIDDAGPSVANGPETRRHSSAKANL